MPDLLDIMKRAALGAVDSTDPATFIFGTVTGTGPVEIQIDQKLTLSTAQLVFMASLPASSLAMGDSVVLLRQAGGQLFVVLGKVVVAS